MPVPFGQNAPAVSVLASIPSPGSGTLDLGPFTVHMYGITLLASIALCTYVAGPPRV